jgi:hypothetical protein
MRWRIHGRFRLLLRSAALLVGVSLANGEAEQPITTKPTISTNCGARRQMVPSQQLLLPQVHVARTNNQLRCRGTAARDTSHCGGRRRVKVQSAAADSSAAFDWAIPALVMV